MKPYLLIQLIILSVVGLLLVIFGLLIWVKKKVSLVHEYHYRNVRSVDIPAYCRLLGRSLVILGIGTILTGVINVVFDTALGWLAFIVGLIVFFVLANRAQKKYNGSWFG